MSSGGNKLNLSLTIIGGSGVVGAAWFFEGSTAALRALAAGCCGAGGVEAFQIRPVWERDQPGRGVNRLDVAVCLTAGAVCLCLALTL